MSFWEEYKGALRKESERDNGRLKYLILENPIPSTLLVMVFGLLIINIIYSYATYQPPAPQPVMTITGFVEYISKIQLPAIDWIIIFGILWFTKW